MAGGALDAAFMITSATSLGFESMETWLALSSVVAFMRLAKKRSSSGAMAWSSVETMYHDGLVFHAAPDTWAANADALMGPWTAAARRASDSGRSEPNFLNASSESVRKPFVSTFGEA